MTQYRKPPWPGNELAVQHGASSPRRIAPVAEQVVREILADPNCPRYLKDDSSYRLSLESLGRLEAICRLLWQFVAEQLEEHGVQALLEDVTEATENEQREGATVTRRSVSRRVESAVNQLRKYEVSAAQARKGLGLDPGSRSKMAARILAPQMLDMAQLAMAYNAGLLNDDDGGEDGDSPAPAGVNGNGSAVPPPAGKRGR